MKRAWIVAMGLVVPGCNFDFDARAEEHRKASRGVEPEGPWTDSEIRARIINDVRDQLYRERVEEGKPTCDGITWEKATPLCARDKARMIIVPISSEGIDRQYPVEETAFLCPEDGLYYYHYSGGKKRLDMWFGPVPSRLRTPPK
jgi:hypothetical protein